MGDREGISLRGVDAGTLTVNHRLSVLVCVGQVDRWNLNLNER